MVSLSCTAEREHGVTLVTGRVRNGDGRRRVRLENRLDGPVWPPRRRGVPADGWDENGVEWVLAPGETRAVGYASPAPPRDPPLVVAHTEGVDDESARAGPTRGGVPSVGDTPAAVVRTLGSPAPPREAVPAGVSSRVEGDLADAGASATDDGAGDGTTGVSGDADVAAVEAWLSSVATRVETAERLGESTRLPAAADAVAAAGGTAGVATLADRLEADARRLRAVAARAGELADRADAAEVPVEAVERLA